MSVDLARLSKDDFAPLVGSAFELRDRDRDRTVALELAAVEALATAPTAPRAAFLLRFRTPATLPQGTYQLEHATLGTLEIFLVPSSATMLDAVFG